MNRIASFLYLDFYTVKPYLKSLYILSVIGVVLSAVFKSMSILYVIFSLGLMMVMSFPFSIAEMNGLDILYTTLPLRRRSVVIGRYTFVLIMETASVIFLMLSFMVLRIFMGDGMTGQQYPPLCALWMVFSLIIALQYPIFFKLGYNKAKIITYIPLCFVLLIIGIWPIMKGNPVFMAGLEIFVRTILSNTYLLYGLPIGIGFFVLILSCMLSCRLYGKKDM